MFSGKLQFAMRVLILAGVTQLAGVQSASAVFLPCLILGTQLESAQDEADRLGFLSLRQPIFYADSTTGLTEDQAREKSTQKVDQFQAWLTQKNAQLSRIPVAPNCRFLQQKREMISAAQAELANLRAFNGPYTRAQAQLDSSPASQSNTYTLPLPCRKDGQAANGLRPCSLVIHDVTTNAEDFMKKMEDAIYRGCDIGDRQLIDDVSSCAVKTTIPVCNYFGGFTPIANPAPEQTVNHLGASCGTYTSVSTSVSGHSCSVSASAMGTLEQSYYQGNMIRAFDCHWAQVRNELAQGALKLTAAAGLDPKTKYSEQISVIAQARQDLLNFKNVGNIEACNGAISGEGHESACKEQAQRKILEQDVAHLAAKEVIERARRSFERFDAGYSGHAFFSDFKSYLRQNEGTAACHGHKSQCNPTDYLNGCYKPLWNNFFVTRSNSVWNAEVCQ